MNRVENGSPDFGFQGFDGDKLRELSVPVPKKETASSHSSSLPPRDEAGLAGKMSVSVFQNFLIDPEDIEAFGLTLDGKTSDERTPIENAKVEQLVRFLKVPHANQNPNLSSVEFSAADFSSALSKPAGTQIRALSSIDESGGAKIYVSSDLGFRDSLLAAQDSYSDFVVGSAKSLGIEVQAGDVARDLSKLVSRSKKKITGISLDTRREAQVDIDGKSVSGIVR